MTPDEVRTKILGLRPRRQLLHLVVEQVEFDVEVEAPSLLIREQFAKIAEKEGVARAMGYLVVACTFAPGSQDRVFRPEDGEKIAGMDANAAAPYVQISEAASQMIQEGADAARKKSEPTPSSV